MTLSTIRRILLIQLVLVLTVVFEPIGAQQPIDMGDPTQVIQAYLRATYARDFVEAYRFIAAEDRKVRDLNRYIQQRGSFNGFTLEVARKVSESVQVGVVKKTGSSNHAQVEIRYKVPDPKKIAPLVLDWDPYRLNSLSAGERGELLKTLDRNKRDGAIAMREGEEKFDLVKEGDEWRMFLNWAAGVKIPLQLDLSKSADLNVGLSKNEVVVQPGDLFEVSLRIKNRTSQAITVRIGHLVAPVEIADYLDFVQCGFLLPVTIQPGKEQEYSGTYLLRGSIPDGVRQLSLNYDFRILK
jgi:hypothetical protein